MIIKDSGIDFAKFFENILQYENTFILLKKYFGFVILFFINLLIKLNKYYIIYGDLKFMNVLINPNIQFNEHNLYSSIMNMIKIIDFDLSTYFKNIPMNNTNIYYVWPIEYIIANNFNKINTRNKLTKINEFNDNLYDMLHSIVSLNNIRESITIIINKFFDELKNLTITMQSYYQKYTDKFDIYSVGIILHELLQFIIYDVSGEILDDANDNYNKYHNICIEMMQLNYDNRISIKQLWRYGIILCNQLGKDAILEPLEDIPTILNGGTMLNKYRYYKYLYATHKHFH